VTPQPASVTAIEPSDSSEVFRYVPHADVARFEAEGWELLPALNGTHHGEHSVLMRVESTGLKPRRPDVGKPKESEMTSQKQKTNRGKANLWLKQRNQAGPRIDPSSADLEFMVLDPYGLLDVTSEENCVGRLYFVRSPDSGGWVSFYDLPDKTTDELWRRINSGDLVDSFEKLDRL
jgi:hypothetical protein